MQRPPESRYSCLCSQSGPRPAHLSQSESESPLSEPDSKSESARESLRGASTSFGLWSAQRGAEPQLEAQQKGIPKQGNSKHE